MDNITGTWIYKEDFGFGKDQGVAIFEQKGDIVSGILKYTEDIKGEPAFEVEQEVVGTFSNKSLCIKGTSIKLIGVDEDFEYNLDNWDGIMNINNQIVGSSYDDKECFGVFTFTKEK